MLYQRESVISERVRPHTEVISLVIRMLYHRVCVISESLTTYRSNISCSPFQLFRPTNFCGKAKFSTKTALHPRWLLVL